jgi:hypothetical protein
VDCPESPLRDHAPGGLMAPAELAHSTLPDAAAGEECSKEPFAVPAAKS